MSSPQDLHLNLSGIEDQYEIIGELGRGGTSIVYLARERELGREVALKVIRDQYLHDAEAMGRFEREAKTLAQLEHPNIITLYTARRLTEGSMVLVMQLTRGHSLRELLRRDRAFPFARVEQVLRDLASALSYLHRRGVIHRDIKPENIFFDEQSNRTLLSDFGIAKAYDGQASVTLTGVVVGTPAYMSPEQIDGAILDGQSDLYSLGLVGWEMLTGQQPWEGENLYSIIVKQKSEPLPALTLLRPGIPEHLRLVIERALEKDRSRRWHRADELLAQLDGASLAPQLRTGKTLPADRPHPALIGATGAETATVAFRPKALVPAAAVPVPATKIRLGRHAYLAAAGAILFAGGAVAFPLLNTAAPSARTASVAPAFAQTAPSPDEGATEEQARSPASVSRNAPAAKPPPAGQLNPRSRTQTAPPPATRTRESRSGEIPLAIPAVDIALSSIPEPALALSAPTPPAAVPPVPPRVASLPSNAPILSPDVAPVLSNHRTVQRQMDRSYPSALRERQVGGTVVLSLVIDERGRVTESSVSNSSGHEQLDAVALNVGRSMRFTPAQHRGRPVQARIEMPLVFDASARPE